MYGTRIHPNFNIMPIKHWPFFDFLAKLNAHKLFCTSKLSELNKWLKQWIYTLDMNERLSEMSCRQYSTLSAAFLCSAIWAKNSVSVLIDQNSHVSADGVLQVTAWVWILLPLWWDILFLCMTSASLHGTILSVQESEILFHMLHHPTYTCMEYKHSEQNLISIYFSNNLKSCNYKYNIFFSCYI
jgi:hypothetical protein